MVPEAPKLNTVRRLERLDSAWKQGSRPVPMTPSVAADAVFDVVSNPSRRNKTPLTDKEVEAIRTARDGGESVLSIAKRFGIHRATVWQYTKAAAPR